MKMQRNHIMKTCIGLTAFCAQLLIAPILAESVDLTKFRNYTNKEGQTAELKIREIKEAADSHVLVVITKQGKKMELPITALSDEDQKLILANQGALSGEPGAVPLSEKLNELIGSDTVVLSGKRLKSESISGDAKYYAFYHSASWCPPCRSFTPKLVEAYNKQGDKKKFEVILVSSDRSEDAMIAYMNDAKMPWPALDFDKGKKFAGKADYSYGGIPFLAIFDQDGKIVSQGSAGEGLQFLTK